MTGAAHRGQAMIESVLAILIVTSVFLCLFRLANSLTGKILLEHAAMRVARARAVGYNDFMCEKAARVAVIPVAGKRITPDGEGQVEELLFAHKYLLASDGSRARGLLHYDKWDELRVRPGRGDESTVSLKTGWFELSGRADAGSDWQLYLNEGGE